MAGMGNRHGLDLGVQSRRRREIDGVTDHEYRYMYDRAGTQATAIGRARLALSDGDPGKAADILDDAVDELHRLHWDACVADGYDPEAITRFLGPRDALCSRSRPRERHPYGDATEALRAAGWTPVGINRWEPPVEETAAEDTVRVGGFVYGETVAAAGCGGVEKARESDG